MSLGNNPEENNENLSPEKQQIKEDSIKAMASIGLSEEDMDEDFDPTTLIDKKGY